MGWPMVAPSPGQRLPCLCTPVPSSPGERPGQSSITIKTKQTHGDGSNRGGLAAGNGGPTLEPGRCHVGGGGREGGHLCYLHNMAVLFWSATGQQRKGGAN